MWSGGCSCGAKAVCVPCAPRAPCAPFAPFAPDGFPAAPPTPDELLPHIRQIPLMNSIPLHYLKNGHLVRFRGMIQDMHNPEFYFETYEVINHDTKESRICTGKYRDTADIGEFERLDHNSPKLKGAERQSITVISLPGFNEWAKQIENSQNVTSHLLNPPSTSKNQNADSGGKMKRSIDEAENCDTSYDMETDIVVNPKKERQKSCNLDNQFASISREHVLNFPIPDDNGKVCIVKVYDQFENLKLNDMVEVIGYLSVDPAMSNHWNANADENDEQLDAETLTHNPPPSLVPRVHAIHIEPIKYCNPLIRSPIDKENIITEARETREHLHKTLTQVLLGDSLAADYLICHLISEV